MIVLAPLLLNMTKQGLIKTSICMMSLVSFLKKYQQTSNKYYYTGQEKDDIPTHFYNLRARYYYTDIGRFTQEDPLIGSEYMCSFPSIHVFPQDFNPYPYCVNDPINKVDPLGLLRLLPWTNWCGPNWSGGQRKPLEKLTPEERASLKPPRSPMDWKCMHHDYCYTKCRVKRKKGLLNEGQFGKCQRRCDIIFALTPF